MAGFILFFSISIVIMSFFFGYLAKVRFAAWLMKRRTKNSYLDEKPIIIKENTTSSKGIVDRLLYTVDYIIAHNVVAESAKPITVKPEPTSNSQDSTTTELDSKLNSNPSTDTLNNNSDQTLDKSLDNNLTAPNTTSIDTSSLSAVSNSPNLTETTPDQVAPQDHNLPLDQNSDLENTENHVTTETLDESTLESEADSEADLEHVTTTTEADDVADDISTTNLTDDVIADVEDIKDVDNVENVETVENVAEEDNSPVSTSQRPQLDEHDPNVRKVKILSCTSSHINLSPTLPKNSKRFHNPVLAFTGKFDLTTDISGNYASSTFYNSADGNVTSFININALSNASITSTTNNSSTISTDSNSSTTSTDSNVSTIAIANNDNTNQSSDHLDSVDLTATTLDQEVTRSTSDLSVINSQTPSSTPSQEESTNNSTEQLEPTEPSEPTVSLVKRYIPNDQVETELTPSESDLAIDSDLVVTSDDQSVTTVHQLQQELEQNPSLDPTLNQVTPQDTVDVVKATVSAEATTPFTPAQDRNNLAVCDAIEENIGTVEPIINSEQQAVTTKKDFNYRDYLSSGGKPFTGVSIEDLEHKYAVLASDVGHLLELQLLAAQIWMQRGSFNKAISIYRYILSVPSWREQHDLVSLNLARCYLKAGMYSRAQDCLSALVGNPNLENEVLELLLHICFLNKDWKQALKLAKECYRKDKTPIKLNQLHNFYLQRLLTCYREIGHRRTMYTFQRIIELDSENQRPLFTRANYLFACKDFANAFIDYQLLLDKDINYLPIVIGNLALCFAQVQPLDSNLTGYLFDLKEKNPKIGFIYLFLDLSLSGYDFKTLVNFFEFNEIARAKKPVIMDYDINPHYFRTTEESNNIIKNLASLFTKGYEILQLRGLDKLYQRLYLLTEAYHATHDQMILERLQEIYNQYILEQFQISNNPSLDLQKCLSLLNISNIMFDPAYKEKILSTNTNGSTNGTNNGTNINSTNKTGESNSNANSTNQTSTNQTNTNKTSNNSNANSVDDHINRSDTSEANIDHVSHSEQVEHTEQAEQSAATNQVDQELPDLHATNKNFTSEEILNQIKPKLTFYQKLKRKLSFTNISNVVREKTLRHSSNINTTYLTSAKETNKLQTNIFSRTYTVDEQQRLQQFLISISSLALHDNQKRLHVKYQCAHCSYTLDRVFWYCPSCHKWESAFLDKVTFIKDKPSISTSFTNPSDLG